MNGLLQYKKYFECHHVTCGLLFLYPLFATVMRHWNSLLFVLILLSGLVNFFLQKRKDRSELHKYEKIFLWLLAANFLVFALTSAIHLPEDISEIRFDIELRFLLVVAVYFLLVKLKIGFKYLVFGSIGSVLIVAMYAFHATIVNGEESFEGIYSHLYTGPMTLIYACISIGYLLWIAKGRPVLRGVLVFFVTLAAVYTIILTYSRVTYISVLFVILLFAVFLTKGWWRWLFIPTLVTVIVVAGYQMPQVSSRMSLAYQEYKEYIDLSKTDKRLTANITSSVGTRMEMWRTAPLILRDNVLLGVGNGNYNKAMQEYIDNKELNPVVGEHSHAHNAFVNVLIVKGMLGLIITCLVLFYPLYVYIKTYRQSMHSAAIGIVFVSIIFLVSMNETAPFVKSNFVASFLLISAVLFQEHMRRIRDS